MKTSLIINTCSMDALAAPRKSLYANAPYGARASLLRDKIILAACIEGWDEIFVVGSFESGKGYRYIPMQPIYRDRRDALWQRELGARHATGDVLAFAHDDHMFAPGTLAQLKKHPQAWWDILVPERVDEKGNLLDNGKDAGYMGGHCLLMKRATWAAVPWTSVDTEWWDVTLTRVWKEEGAKIMWTDDLTHIDLDQVPVLAIV